MVDLPPSAHEIRVDPDHVLGMVAADADGRRTREYMHRAYRAMPDALAAVFGVLFDRIARRDLPLLVHCAAGKDRTGFVCAVLLTALGVPERAGVEDYMRSRERVSPERVRLVLQARGLEDPEAAIEAFTVREEYLADAVAVLVERWGRSSAISASTGCPGKLSARRGRCSSNPGARRRSRAWWRGRRTGPRA